MKFKYKESLYLKTVKKKKKPKVRIYKRKDVEAFAKKLATNPPKSEVWFSSLFKNYSEPTDEYNVVFGGYIPDVINKKYKYIIEIDGSIHNLPHIQDKDRKKDRKFYFAGYQVIRIKAYNIVSFEDGLNRVLECRDNYSLTKSFTKEGN